MQQLQLATTQNSRHLTEDAKIEACIFTKTKTQLLKMVDMEFCVVPIVYYTQKMLSILLVQMRDDNKDHHRVWERTRR